VMLTFREHYGRNGLWAWVGDATEPTTCQIAGVHFNDCRSVGLKDGYLHIDNDGHCGQFTRYFLRPPEGAETSVEVTADVKVLSNQGSAACLSVPFAGTFHFFPDHVTFSQLPDWREAVEPGEFHSYRMVSREGQITLDIDGERVLTSDKTDGTVLPQAWTPAKPSIHSLAFGNDSAWTESPIHRVPESVTPAVSGHSVWRRVEATLEDPTTGRHHLSWSAQDGFPDQYILDHVIQVEETESGTVAPGKCTSDQGYSGWTTLQDGRVFVVAYTDDGTPRWRVENGTTIGGSWIRGTFIAPANLPQEVLGK